MRSTVARNGTEIAYRATGDESPGVVFVHGWMTSSRVWHPFVEDLELGRRRRVVPDLRGAGSSSAADTYTLESYIEDLEAVVDDLDLEHFDLVGHSMGGQIAQLFAAEHPSRVRRLVLLSPVPVSGLDLPDEAEQLFRNAGGDAEALGAILDQASLHLDERTRARLVEAAVEIPATCVRRSYDAWTGADCADRLEEIRAETLVVASDDPFLPAEFLQETVVEPIEKARLVRIADAGHYTHLERPEAARDQVESFLKD